MLSYLLYRKFPQQPYACALNLIDDSIMIKNMMYVIDMLSICKVKRKYLRRRTNTLLFLVIVVVAT